MLIAHPNTFPASSVLKVFMYTVPSFTISSRSYILPPSLEAYLALSVNSNMKNFGLGTPY